MRNVILLSSLSAEKSGLRANEAIMGHLTASQYGLRARVDAHDRPLGQQTDRQRAMQAAFEVLKGTISPRC